MLTASPRRPRRRPRRRSDRDAGAIRTAAAALTALAALLVPAVGARPARADAVRTAQQWVLDAMNVPAAWQVTQGGGVTVAVIDSGVDGAIPDLASQVHAGPDLTGVSTPPASPDWGIHGTWMASLIAGHGHGGAGIEGVAPRARILSIRVITDRQDPSYSAFEAQGQPRIQHELAAAIRYAARHGAGVISMSLGYAQPSLAVRSALQFAFNRGVVVVASSGNSGTGATPLAPGQAPYSFPATYLGVLGVAAVNRAGLPASFSSENLSVEIAAPGVNVPAAGRDGKYWLVSGTSPACALVAGVAALVKAAYPRLSAEQVRTVITATARTRPGRGYDDQVGFGTVDAAAALVAARTLAAGHRARGGPPVGPSAHFGARSAAAPVPVGGRGRRWLAVLAALAVISLLLAGASVWLLATSRRAARRRSLAAGPGVPAGPPVLAGPGGPGGSPGDALGAGHAGPAGPGGPAAFPVPHGYSSAREQASQPRFGSPPGHAGVPGFAGPGWPAGAAGADLVAGFPAPAGPGEPPGHPRPAPATAEPAGPVPRGAEAARTTVPRFGRSRPPGGRHAAPRDQGQHPGEPS